MKNTKQFVSGSLQFDPKNGSTESGMATPVADPDLELREGGGGPPLDPPSVARLSVYFEQKYAVPRQM